MSPLPLEPGLYGFAFPRMKHFLTNIGFIGHEAGFLLIAISFESLLTTFSGSIFMVRMTTPQSAVLIALAASSDCQSHACAWNFPTRFCFLLSLISIHRVLEAGLAFLARRANYLLKHSLARWDSGMIWGSCTVHILVFAGNFAAICRGKIFSSNSNIFFSSLGENVSTLLFTFISYSMSPFPAPKQPSIGRFCRIRQYV